MSTAPKAPLTAHLRGRIQKRIRRNPPPPINTPDAGAAATDDVFRDTELYSWVRIPEDLHEAERTGLASQDMDFQVLIDADGGQKKWSCEDNAQTDKFCALLKELAKDFEDKGRSYCAFAAQSAIALTLDGRQDDINPGLWPFIRRMEEKKIREEQ